MTGVEIIERRAWRSSDRILLIGPGGAGKSSLGRVLAPMTGRRLIDLDREFCERIADIDAYIRDVGYAEYKKANSALAQKLFAGTAGPSLLVTSSGFLTPDNPPDALAANLRLLEDGYSLCLLPASNVDAACETIVERQMARGLAKEAEDERRTARARFPVYRALGDMLIVSAAPPREIAKAVAARLAGS